MNSKVFTPLCVISFAGQLILAQGVTDDPQADPKCPEVWDPLIEVFLPNKSNCTEYFHCVHGMPVQMACPSDLYWDQSIQLCNFPYLLDPPCPEDFQDGNGGETLVRGYESGGRKSGYGMGRGPRDALNKKQSWAHKVKSMIDTIASNLDNVDKAISVAEHARQFILSTKSDHAIIINLSDKQLTWYTYNDVAPIKWNTPFRSYMGPYTTVSVHTIGWGAMQTFKNNKNPAYTVQRGNVYYFDGHNLTMWFKSK